jgi:hypothetical protein
VRLILFNVESETSVNITVRDDIRIDDVKYIGENRTMSVSRRAEFFTCRRSVCAIVALLVKLSTNGVGWRLCDSCTIG